MASPSLPRVPGRAFVIAALATLLLAPAAHALRVVDYNVLNYPGSSGAARDPNFRIVLAPLAADVIVTEEQTSQAGVNEFLNSVLNTMDPADTWGVMSFINGNDSDCALFYRKATVDTLGHWAFYPSATNLRLINVFRVRPKGYASDAAELRLYTAHLKASQGFETDRLNECIGIRDSMNAMPAGTHALLCGDMNFYTTEVGYQKLLEDQVNDIGRVYDVLPAGTWHDGATFATIHTQSTCLTGCLYGEATGGKDDRFDFILPTLNLNSTQGLALVPGTMVTTGADDQHFNKAITDAPAIPEGATYAAALLGTSDHLPVRVDLQVPARIGKPALLAFSTVIVGAPTPSRDLGINNTASPPADSLNCSFTAPAGFGAPGPLAVAAGSSAPATLTMSTAAVGSLAGLLTINCDAPDSLVNYVNLMGTVIAHAQASLDPSTVVVGDTLDFGEHLAGGFAALEAPIWNVGYNPLQARFYVSGAQITGGDGRFTLHGFSPTLLTVGTNAWQVRFNDAGATTDSTYEATLVYQSSDEALPGATSQPDVHDLLRARVASGSVAVEPTLPASTRLYPPMPNPLASGTTLRFDLARAARARLEIFDLSGRRVATLADQDFTPGRYSLRWDGHDDAGATTGAGLYFVRLTAPGMGAQMARLVVVR